MEKLIDKKLAGRLAAAAFAGLFLLQIYGTISNKNHLSISIVFLLLGYAVTAAGLFLGKRVLTAVGSGVMFLRFAVSNSYFASARGWVWEILDGDFYFVIELFKDLALGILSVAPFALLLVACLKPSAAVPLCLAAAGCRLVNFGISVITRVQANHRGWDIVPVVTLVSVLNLILFVAGFVFGGIALYEPAAKPSQVKTHAGAAKTAGQIQRLSNLKALLDQNIITQEEFEEKKQKILHP